MLDAMRSAIPIILKACTVQLSDFLLKLMVSALRIMLNGSSREVSNTTVLISHSATNTQAKLSSRSHCIVTRFPPAVVYHEHCTSF